MKAIYNDATTLQTESRVRIEANYNRTIFGMTKTGDTLYYQAPSDPAEHPMYVDSQGRIMPVDPDTLQPMYNESGNVVDSNGVLLPRGDVNGILAHRDDIRVAVTSADFEVKDEEGNDILVAHDGEIIPTDDDGLPGVTMVGGVPWVIGKDGEPHAPLEQVYALRSYARPVRAENVPIDKAGNPQPIPDPAWPEFFDIDHIVRADRPRRRGSLIGWATSDSTDTPISTGVRGYDGARLYVASEDSKYKYWTSPGVSEADPVLTGGTIDTFGSSWNVSGGTNKTSGTNMVSADFGVLPGGAQGYIERVLPVSPQSNYNMAFSVLAQTSFVMTVQLLQWTDVQSGTLDTNSGSMLPIKELTSQVIPGGVMTNVNFDIVPDMNVQTYAVRILVRRYNHVPTPKITFSNLAVMQAVYPISGVGPRAVYDRPVLSNKIVIGVDPSVNETAGAYSSHAHVPADSDVRVYVDRGDGFFEWQKIATNPEIDEDGMITLYYDGTNWGEEVNYDAVAPIMGVQYNVYGMKMRDRRVNVMEISARRVYDVSDLLISYSLNSEVSDDSFVLPFGTVNSNTGTVALSNHDGRFNSENEYLLDPERPLSEAVFTDIKNPFYQMLNESVQVTIDTATFVPGDNERNFIRMATATTDSDSAPGSDMIAELKFSDSAKLLSKLFPNQAFYTGESMSVIEVIYTLLDRIGFTSVRFSAEDEHFSSHLKYFWVKPDEKSIWQIIQDICRATQTVAFFDEYDVLNFKSLKGMYDSALASRPAQVFTSEDLPGINANIIDSELTDKVTVNRVSVNYRETMFPERTPSGATPMEAVWEPEGTQVIRGQYLTADLNDKSPGEAGATVYLSMPSGTTQTWPFSGMVQVEGELIKYDGKQYKYHSPNGTAKTKVIFSEDERKELDKSSGKLFEMNVYTGRLKISERGAEGTRVEAHIKDPLSSLTRRYRVGSGTTVNNFKTGISIKNSRLYIKSHPKPKSASRTTVTSGSSSDYMPHHMGTTLNITRNGHAGIAFYLDNPNDDGVFVCLSTTDAIEGIGRWRGELHIFTVKGGVVKYYGRGVDVPVSKNKDYTLDVSVRDGGHINVIRDYSDMYEIVLKYGSTGNAVRVLQSALNEHGEKLEANGRFNSATRTALRRFQRRRGLTVDGIVNQADWKALEKGKYDENMLSVSATVDGNYQYTVQIPKADLPSSGERGRFGVFTRSSTDASFEYMYAIRGAEPIDYDSVGFYDYISGGYVSDQLYADWIYNTRIRYFTPGGKREARRVVTNQLKMIDFGPYAHEVRDYEVVFDRDNPALASFLYLSNEPNVHVVDYVHYPYGAKFRIANKARRDVILNGEDAVTFDAENTVEQKMLIYGTVLKIDDKRTVTVSNNDSINSRGVEELTIDAQWVQSEDSANKLASHIVEAMSHGATSHSMDVFGNASVRVGQVVAVYDPRRGIGDPANPGKNRFFVSGVTHENDGGHSTNVKTREVIGGSGMRQITLSDVLAANNNALNTNHDIEDYVKVGNLYLPAGYTVRSGADARFATPLVPSANGGGAVQITGTGSSAYQTSIVAHPYPNDSGRFAHNYGDYYLLVADVTANTDATASVVIEGWPTTGSMIKVIASKSVRMRAGRNKKIVLKGRFLSDPEIPELYVGVRLLAPGSSSGGGSDNTITVNSLYYRSSQNEEDIYPLHGGEQYRKL